MRRQLFAGAAVLVLSFSNSGMALAQDASREQLPPVTIEDDASAAAAFSFGDTLDSGTSTFDATSVEARTPGSGDVNQLLKALPGSHFSLGEGLATRANLQDLRPEQVSISGGRVNENLFVLDGVDASSRLDFSNDNAANYSEVAGASPQAFWVDGSLVGGVTVRDSNVSAEYGRFSGGVVEIVTRTPARTFGGHLYYSFTNSDLTSFKASDGSRAALGGVLPDEPVHDKVRYGLSLDLPIGDQIRTLIAYSRSEAEVTNFRGANYGNEAFGQQSTSQNFLAKAEVDLPRGMLLSGQLTWTPYESEASSATAIENTVVSNGGGWTGRLTLAGAAGEADWKLDATYSRSETDRDGALTQYNVTRVGTGIDWCSAGSSCTRGFIGPLQQRETGYSLKGYWSQPLAGGDFRGGFEIGRSEAFKKRPQTTYAYLGTSINANTVCTDPNEGPACVAGVYALSRRLEYRAFEAEAAVDTVSLWGEQAFETAGFTVRAGARLEHDGFLGNWDLAPRLSVARPLPWGGATLTLGANRYYARSFLGYALREGQPGNFGYTRAATVSGASRIWSDNWILTSHSNGASYSDSDLSTPYSDELTAAVSGPFLGGRYRVRAVQREGRDEFASSASETVTYVTELGGNSTYRSYTITNDGESLYRGLHVEWQREFGRQAVSVSASYSKTETSNVDYFLEADDEAFGAIMVYYNGAVRPWIEVAAENQREDHASPLLLNADWSASWWGGRVRTNVNARFRDAFERIADTLTNISVGGTSYDVYERVSYDASVDFNLNVTADVAAGEWGIVTLEAKIDNLLDSLPYRNDINTSQPYQLGRAVWVGAKVRF